MHTCVWSSGGARWGVAAAFFLLAVAYAVVFPIVDWDAIPYLYLAHSLLGESPAQAHASAYAALTGLPSGVFSNLQKADIFRQVAFLRHESLAQVSAFYADRIGFYGLLGLLIACKLPPVAALQALNMLGQTLVAAAYAFRTRFQNWYYVYGFIVFLFFPSILKVARWTNPDGLSAGLFLMAMALLWPFPKPVQIHKKQYVAAYMLLGAMVLCRPNMVCFLLPLAGGFAYIKEYRNAIVFMVLSTFAVAIHMAFPGYGLPVLWAHTFADEFSYPAIQNIPFQIDGYIALVGSRLADLHGRDLLLACISGLSLLSIYLSALNPVRVLSFALAGGCVLQFLLFPAFWERLFIAPVLVLFYAGTTAWIKKEEGAS